MKHTEFTKDGSQIRFTTVAEAQKVYITCRTVGLVTPQREQHRALEDKKIPVVGLAEALQKSFQPILGQDQLEILPPLARQVH